MSGNLGMNVATPRDLALLSEPTEATRVRTVTLPFNPSLPVADSRKREAYSRNPAYVMQRYLAAQAAFENARRAIELYHWDLQAGVGIPPQTAWPSLVTVLAPPQEGYAWMSYFPLEGGLDHNLSSRTGSTGLESESISMAILNRPKIPQAPEGGEASVVFGNPLTLTTSQNPAVEDLGKGVDDRGSASSSPR